MPAEWGAEQAAREELRLDAERKKGNNPSFFIPLLQLDLNYGTGEPGIVLKLVLRHPENTVAFDLREVSLQTFSNFMINI